MNPPDPRLEDLFVRYWDDALTDAEAAELERALLDHPDARDWFRFLCLQATTAAELSSVHRLLDSPALAEVSTLPEARSLPHGSTYPEVPVLSGAAPARGWSRRRVLKYAGGGVAASVLASVAGWRLWGGSPADRVRLAVVRGTVTVTTPRGTEAARAGALIPPGATVATDGVNSGAALVCSDGTEVSLCGDSALIVHEGGRRLLLVRGNATADIRPKPDVPPLQLATSAATVTTATGALLNLGHLIRATEVVVQDGAVNVFDPSEHRLAVVGAGETFTIRNDGRKHKRPTPVTPDEYAMPIDQPLPAGWHVGERAVFDGHDVLVPRPYKDPYHANTEMWQIRSDKQWARGFFRLFPGSTVHVKYWVDRPGRGQVIACVRKARLPDAATGVLELNGAFEDAPAGRWDWLHMKADDMLDNANDPKFPAPWVAFLLIFNTYTADLGLRVAEYRVTPPGVS